MKDLFQKFKILVFIDHLSIYLIIIIVIIIITIILIIIIITIIIITIIIIIIIIIISLFALDRTISHHFLSAIIFRIATIHLFQKIYIVLFHENKKCHLEPKVYL